MGNDDSDHIPPLSRDNHEDWFQDMTYKLKGKGIFYTIQTTEKEFAWITLGDNARSDGSLKNTTPSVDDITAKIGKLGGCWNIDKQKEWQRDEANALFHISKAITTDDKRSRKEYPTAKEFWAFLQAKYTKTSASTANTYMTKLQNFEFDREKGIDGAWETLKDYRRKLIAANSNLRHSYPDDMLFLILTKALPKPYRYLVDGFTLQQHLSVDDKIKILGDKEEELESDEHANTAFRPYRYPDHQRRRSSDSSTGSQRHASEPLCFLCEGHHLAKHCEYGQHIKRFGRRYREEQERLAKRPFLDQRSRSRSKAPERSRSRAPERSRSRAPGKSSLKWRDGSKPKVTTDQPKKLHGYAAQGDSSSDSDQESDSGLLGEDSHSDTPVEKCHISRDQISKSTPTDWVADTGASSNMTDQKNLFRGPLIRLPRRVSIQVGGGVLYSSQRGIAEIVCKDGSSCLIRDTLFVPKLGVNLVSAKRLCKNGLTGSFDDTRMDFKDGKKTVIQAEQDQGLYIVKHISKSLQSRALVATVTDQPAKYKAVDQPTDNYATIANTTTTKQTADDTVAVSDSEVDPDDSGEEEAATKQERRTYRLMHRRFGHYGPNLLRNLHKVSNLSKIKIPPADRRLCEPCTLAKMRNRFSKVLAEHKKEPLALVSLDIAGPFPKSLRGNNYFLQIIDNHTRKNWSLPLKSKDEAMSALRRWRVKEERQSGKTVKAARSDNAPELHKELAQWEKEDGVQTEHTIVASSHQNGPAERSIQTSENSMRAMLKAQNLPLEFWDEAVEFDAYIRNRMPTGPTINGQLTSPELAYTGVMPDTKRIRVWGSKCISYMNPKTLPAEGRHDKLVLRGREGVFMGYVNATEKQLKVYSPDLGYTHRVSVLTMEEKIKGGTLDLKLRNNPNGSQGTPIDLPDRRGRGRPRKDDTVKQQGDTKPATSEVPTAAIRTTPVVEIPFKALEENIPSFTEDQDGNIHTVPNVLDNSAPEVPESRTEAQPEPQPEPQPMEVNKQPTPQGTTNEANLPRYFFRKRKRDSETPEESDRQAKIVKAMLAIILNGELEDTTGQDKVYAFVATTASNSAPFLSQSQSYSSSGKEQITKAFLTAITSEPELPEDVALPAIEVNGIRIPRTYKEAVSDKHHATEWGAAIKEEITSLVSNGTWEEFVLPHGANLVSTKWVFTVKTKSDGSVERFKARLVARGFSQEYGTDYTETFAPTVRMDTLRLFLAIVAKFDLECCQFDIKNAFTESHLKEDIYLAPPEGVEVKKGKVLKALRSLYGLKQASRDWSLLLKSFLIESGFHQSLADPCLYVHPERRIWLLVYVDDIPAAARQQEQLDWFYKILSTRFNAKNLGEISKILGVRVTRDRKNKTIYLDQEQYLSSVLDKFGISKGTYKAKKIPTADYTSLRPADSNDVRIDPSEYRQGIGSLMYGMVFTRPDIAFVLGRLAQYMSDPAEHHGHALKNVMRYIRSTIKQKLRFGPGGAHRDQFGMYTDADWASDKTDRKSISGGVGMFYGGPFSWASKKQTGVSTSSAESEYISQSMYAKQGQWTAQIFRDLGIPECINSNQRTVQMYGDNQGALALVKNPHLHERSKHIDICYHYVRDLAEKFKLQITYVPTAEMIADGMTKPLLRVAFERFKAQLGVVDIGDTN